MSYLEVRQLRYFVAVAEELHFGRAAERLGMAQPPLSRAIRELERQLGVTLMERTTRRVTLTSAGEILLRDARTALDAVTAAARRARQAGQPEPGLRLALKADYDGGLLPQIFAAYQNEAAALPVELVLGGRGEQEPALRDGRADIALLPRPSATFHHSTLPWPGRRNPGPRPSPPLFVRPLRSPPSPIPRTGRLAPPRWRPHAERAKASGDGRL